MPSRSRETLTMMRQGMKEQNTKPDQICGVINISGKPMSLWVLLLLKIKNPSFVHWFKETTLFLSFCKNMDQAQTSPVIPSLLSMLPKMHKCVADAPACPERSGKDRLNEIFCNLSPFEKHFLPLYSSYLVFFFCVFLPFKLTGG